MFSIVQIGYPQNKTNKETVSARLGNMSWVQHHSFGYEQISQKPDSHTSSLDLDRFRESIRVEMLIKTKHIVFASTNVKSSCVWLDKWSSFGTILSQVNIRISRKPSQQKRIAPLNKLSRRYPAENTQQERQHTLDRFKRYLTCVSLFDVDPFCVQLGTLGVAIEVYDTGRPRATASVPT